MNRGLGWLAVVAQLAAIAGLLVTAANAERASLGIVILGLALIAVGAILLLIAFRHLGPALTPNPVPNGTGLRQHGLYGKIRHPIYSGLLLACLGIVLVRPGLWPALCWLGLAGVLAGKALWEERMLRAEFPEYADYQRRTGRFWPRLGG